MYELKPEHIFKELAKRYFSPGGMSPISPCGRLTEWAEFEPGRDVGLTETGLGAVVRYEVRDGASCAEG